MDYKKKYKIALEKAKSIMEGKCEKSFVYNPDLFEYLFDELGEQNDLEKEYQRFVQEEWFNNPGKYTMSQFCFEVAKHFAEWGTTINEQK